MPQLLLFFAALTFSLLCSPAYARVETLRVLNFTDQDALPEGFTHFPYVNPDAPKGGVLRLHATESYNSMNPFSTKGTVPPSIGLTTTTLMAHQPGEFYIVYPLLAEYAVIDSEQRTVDFHLNPRAGFHDGSPVTAHDVAFSFEAVMNNLRSHIQQFFQDVDRVEVISDKVVRFHLVEGYDEKIMLYVAQMPIHSKRFWADKDLDREYFGPVLGSGAYRLVSFGQGKKLVYERVKDYWGKDLPTERGRNNFDIITIEYYRDESVALEAFLAGHYDYREERSVKRWSTLYNTPAFHGGELLKKSYLVPGRKAMQGLFINLRNPLFQRREARQALLLAYDFEWANRVFYNNTLVRQNSYYTGSAYAAHGLPDADELALLEPFVADIPSEIFSQAPAPLPVSSPDGFNRPNLLAAAELLKSAGFTLLGGQLYDPEGREFAFEILVTSQALRRELAPYVSNLRKLGIRAGVRLVDTPGYLHKKGNYDFDLIKMTLSQPGKLGMEQRLYWHSENAKRIDGQNQVGLQAPVVDYLTELIATTRDGKKRRAAARALDRILRWGVYVIPLGTEGHENVAYSSAIVPPDSIQVLDENAWWHRSALPEEK